MAYFIYPKESYAVQGAIFAVYAELGPGLLEEVYQECLEIEFSNRHIPFKVKPKLNIWYRDTIIQKYYIPDFVCYDKIIIELKSVEALSKIHFCQVLNYLKITRFKLGILVNFNSEPNADVHRIVN